jgi:ABC-2 type transport system permease protein
MAFWNLIIATADMAIYLLLGAFAFGIDFRSVNIFSALIVLFLTMISFGSLGIFSASFIIIFKRGNPLGWVLSGLEGLIGGVYFPVTVLPAWLQAVANLLPITYAVRAFQLSVYKGYNVPQLAREIGMLALFCAAFLPLSVFAFRLALDKARRDGSLAQH